MNDATRFDDDELMFEFDQELDALPLEATSCALTDVSQDGSFRPPNPVAFLLHGGRDGTRDGSSLGSPSPLGACSFEATSELSSFAGCEPTAFCQQLSAPLDVSATHECFDFNGRRKRKFCDEISRSFTPRVRPRPRRLTTFSAKELLPHGDPSEEEKRARKRHQSGSEALMLARCPSFQEQPKRKIDQQRTRSESIFIPQQQTGTKTSSSSVASRLTNGSGSSTKPHSSSWNTTTVAASSSLDYLCRTSLDISSPLRHRFRDLVVGSISSLDRYSTE